MCVCVHSCLEGKNCQKLLYRLWLLELQNGMARDIRFVDDLDDGAPICAHQIYRLMLFENVFFREGHEVSFFFYQF